MDTDNKLTVLLKECEMLEECAIYSMKGHFNDAHIAMEAHRKAAHECESLLVEAKKLKLKIMNDCDYDEACADLDCLLRKKQELNAEYPMISQGAYEKVKQDYKSEV